MLLACMIAATGTPWRREIVSMFSPCATTMAVPPSQLQFCCGAGARGGGAAGGTEPVYSGRPGGGGGG
jgi:hypothetical protein